MSLQHGRNAAVITAHLVCKANAMQMWIESLMRLGQVCSELHVKWSRLFMYQLHAITFNQQFSDVIIERLTLILHTNVLFTQ